MSENQQVVTAASEGWTWLRVSSRRHYFREGLSLCRWFAVYPWAKHRYAQQHDPATDCPFCARRLRPEKKLRGER